MRKRNSILVFAAFTIFFTSACSSSEETVYPSSDGPACDAGDAQEYDLDCGYYDVDGVWWYYPSVVHRSTIKPPKGAKRVGNPVYGSNNVPPVAPTNKANTPPKAYGCNNLSAYKPGGGGSSGGGTSSGGGSVSVPKPPAPVAPAPAKPAPPAYVPPPAPAKPVAPAPPKKC